MAKTILSQGTGVPVMTAQHEANHDVKVRFVDALFRNDWETMAELVTDDLELQEPDALPYGGTWKGLDGFKKCWELIPQASHVVEHLDTLRTFFSEDPNHIWVELDFKGVKKATGEKFGTRVMEEFQFRDGKISVIALMWFNIPAFDKA
ncbi:MAG TPA: nuclear transport factor 2 family protein [Sphingobium sp.]|uniref:nuclear transport factor 2 family protein n=1 Tax=Sphingobium sp. TaxID=1912891 RepID=UPI002ED0ECAF